MGHVSSAMHAVHLSEAEFFFIAAELAAIVRLLSPFIIQCITCRRKTCFDQRQDFQILPG